MTINTLLDDVLLDIFDFYLAEALEVEAWHTLAHVCRQWRILVFSSRHRLKLRIACTNHTPVGEKLDIWPSLPIVISSSCNCGSETCLDNIMTALSHRHRVYQIELSLVWEMFDDCIFEALDQSFPKLAVLKLHSSEPYRDSIFPYSGESLGCVIHLQSLSLTCFSFPGLPNLLLSSTDLVDLRLMEIPTLVFISPDKLVTALSALAKLQVLHLGPKFDEDDLHPDWENRLLPLPTRTVLPSLIELKFEGAIEYLEDFMARIDAPQLDLLDIIVYFPHYRVIARDARTPQLLQFISHVPKLRALTEARIGIYNFRLQAWIKFLPTRTSGGSLKLEICCKEPELQFPFLAQFCLSPFFPLPTLESLYIDRGTFSRRRLRDDTENTRWMELLRPFTSVKNLYLSKAFARRIVPTLEDLRGEIVTEVLPTLENVFIEKLELFGPVCVPFRNIVETRVTRQLSSDHPIVVSDWDRTGREVGDC